MKMEHREKLKSISEQLSASSTTAAQNTTKQNQVHFNLITYATMGEPLHFLKSIHFDKNYLSSS